MSTTGQPLNFNAADPAAPSGDVNVVFQADVPTAPPTAVVRNISAYMPPMTATVGGAVPTPPNDSTKFLNGQGNWRVPPGGGGGGSNDDISYYLSPATITPPALTTWGYHTNAVYGFNANGAEVLTTHSSSFIEVIGQTVSAGDFDVITCLAMNPPLVAGGTVAFGLYLWDSGSGKIVRFFFEQSVGAVPILVIQHYPSFTSSSTTTVYGSVNMYLTTSPVWMRINYSRGTYYFYLSVDGQSWDLCYSESSTAYLPVEATNAGFGIYVTATTPANLVVPHFAVVGYVGS